MSASLQFVLDLRELRQMPQQAGLERTIAVNWDRQAYDAAWLAVDVMRSEERRVGKECRL